MALLLGDEAQQYGKWTEYSTVGAYQPLAEHISWQVYCPIRTDNCVTVFQEASVNAKSDPV